ncbi:uncharacterized protein EAE97_009658 [Botrytis byssoidea]|uniref:Uncharacterized protein n=1 Tax=Botrytis byssoidea TaxID=139641 RepID=A0A9P5IB62_9HELO|nr:uncharacterized protein EAE97_009658 [Botrytis byssoidea]KAF7928816.1 hypothetical protein EAE97_009658 [Botrytis byssoidea]
MSSSFQTSISDLAGIHVPSKNVCEWIFQGDTISMNQYFGDIAEDLAPDLVNELSTSCNFATVNIDQHKKIVNTSARSSFDHRLSDSTCAASSYADTETSMRPQYTSPSSESISQSSIIILTPTTSVDDNGDNNIPVSQNDSIGLQHQSAYSSFPTYTSSSTPLHTWVGTPEVHEQMAFNLSDPKTHLATQKKGKKLAGK